MPDISATIRTRLLADSSISELVGTRCYSDALPQGCKMPAISYFVVYTEPQQCLSASAPIVDLSMALIQVDCYSKTRTQANLLGDHVRLRLQGHNHTATGSQYIMSIVMDDGERHLYDEPEEGSDQRRLITSLDFKVYYRTTTS